MKTHLKLKHYFSLGVILMSMNSIEKFNLFKSEWNNIKEKIFKIQEEINEKIGYIYEFTDLINEIHLSLLKIMNIKEFGTGKTEIWYWRNINFYLKVSNFKNLNQCIPLSLEELKKSHVLIARTNETKLKTILHDFQQIDSSEFTRILDLNLITHQSMAIGDIIKIDNTFYLLADEWHEFELE